MLYISYIILVLALLIDLIFYLTINIHMYLDEKSFYIYIYSIPIIVIDSDKYVNLLKDKIAIDKIINTQKEDLKIIKSVKINKFSLTMNYENVSDFVTYIYPLLSLNYFNKIIKLNISNKTKVYIKINVKIVNFIYELIKIRREKYERTSNK